MKKQRHYFSTNVLISQWQFEIFGHRDTGCKPVAATGNPLKRIDAPVILVRFSVLPVTDDEFIRQQGIYQKLYF